VHEEGDARKGKYSSKYRDLEGEENGQQTESTWKKDKYAKDKEYRTEKEPYKQKEYNKESEKNVTGEYEVEEENQNEVADLDLRSALLREMKKYKIDDRPHSFTSIPKDRSYTVLMVAEKPSIAKSIAEALAPGKNFKSVKGRSPVCLIHQFEYNIFGRKCFVKITSVAGHIYGRDFPGKYASWDRTDPAELFDAPTIKQYSEPKQRMSEHLKNEGRNADFLVLWLDNDREGENICFEVTSLVQPVMRSNRFKQIYRAVFSSLAPEDLRNAYKSLSKGPNMEESLSVDAR
jgi:DNA topoisomerase-3